MWKVTCPAQVRDLQVYRKEMEQTDFLLPTRIVRRALAQAHARTGLLKQFYIHICSLLPFSHLKGFISFSGLVLLFHI